MLILLTMLVTGAQAPVVTPQDKPRDPIVCTVQHDGDEVGTRLQPKKICMKQSERDLIQKITSEEAQRFINNGRNLATPGGGR